MRTHQGILAANTVGRGDVADVPRQTTEPACSGSTSQVSANSLFSPDAGGVPRNDASPSLNDLYRTQAARLLRLFSRRVGTQDAEDLMQDSFVRIARIAASGDPEIERPDAYLSRIAANLLHDRAKSAFERARLTQLPADELLLTGPDPVAALEARDVLNRLNSAILRMSPTTREVFMAHRLEGLSHAHIAERLGISTASVARHMTKAIAQIQRVMRSR